MSKANNLKTDTPPSVVFGCGGPSAPRTPPTVKIEGIILTIGDFTKTLTPQQFHDLRDSLNEFVNGHNPFPGLYR